MYYLAYRSIEKVENTDMLAHKPTTIKLQSKETMQNI